MKKSMIHILFMTVMFNVFFLLPTISIAATQVPIQAKNNLSIAEPETIAFGQLENGIVSVPIRVFFETYDAEVHWQPDTQTVTIKRCDGAVITLAIDNKTVKIVQNNKSENVTIDIAPKIRDGKTMVPLRFVAENLLCHVEWVDHDKKVVITKEYITNTLNENQYTVNLKTEDFYAKIGSNDFQRIGRLDNMKDYYDSIKPDYSNIKKVEQTANGNYMITMDFDGLDAKTSRQIYAYINVKHQSSIMSFLQQSIFGSVDYHFYFDQASVWLPEENQALKINDLTGEKETVYVYKDILQQSYHAKTHFPINDIENIGFDYCDGTYILLSYHKKSTFNTKYFILINLKTNEPTDIIEEIVPSEDRKDFIRKDFISPTNYLEFVKADGNKLYFNYIKFDDLQKPTAETISYQYET